MINNSLYSAGILAIPLKEDTNFNNSLQPNYLIIDSQNGRIEGIPFMNPETGQEEPTTCAALSLSFQYRTEWTDNKSLQALIYPSKSGMEYLPIKFIGLLEDYTSLIENEPFINIVLSLFSFENGSILEGFNPKLDVNMCNKIIEEKRLMPIIEKVLYSITQNEVDEYLTTLDMTIEDFSDRQNVLDSYNSKQKQV